MQQSQIALIQLATAVTAASVSGTKQCQINQEFRKDQKKKGWDLPGKNTRGAADGEGTSMKVKAKQKAKCAVCTALLSA